MTKSVVFREEGLRKSEELFRTLLIRYVANIKRGGLRNLTVRFLESALNQFTQESSRPTSSIGKSAPPVTGSAYRGQDSESTCTSSALSASRAPVAVILQHRAQQGPARPCAGFHEQARRQGSWVVLAASRRRGDAAASPLPRSHALTPDLRRTLATAPFA